MDQNRTNDEIEIDLKELAGVLISRIWIILITGVMLAILAFILSKFVMSPQYESTTKIYVLNKQDDSATISYQDLQSGTQLTKDYMTLVTSRPVLEQVIADLKLPLAYEELAKKISVTNPQDTRILEITVDYKEPNTAKQIADAVRDAAAVHITDVMDIDKVNIVEEANIPEEPSEPNTLHNTIIGGAFGIFFSGFIILIIYLLNDNIKTPEDIEKYLGISVLSTIPIQVSMKPAKKKSKKNGRFIEKDKGRRKSGKL